MSDEFKRQVEVDWNKWNKNQKGPLDVLLFWFTVGILTLGCVVGCLVNQ